MNRTMKFGTLAMVAVFSGAVLAQAVRTKPRVEEGIVRPGTRTMETAPTAKSFGSSKSATTRDIKPLAPTTSVGESCSKQDLASGLAKDTRTSYATALAIVEAGLINMGNCNGANGGVITYNVQARENLLKALEYALNNGAGQKTGAARDAIINEGFKVAGVPATAEKLRKECNIIR